MRKLIDLHPVIDLITEKLNGDRHELRRILDARNADDLRDFEEQDRLLSEIQAGVRALDILEGNVDADGEQTGVRNAVLPSVARLIASE
ncbi:MAG: hypothetical protein K2Y29_06005 [Beijerinckiaceae bacterium]|nr:hypothetical protein [Beijerinckiaceae bacterium]